MKLFIVLLFCFSAINAQDINYLKLGDIPNCYNIDSLEKIKITNYSTNELIGYYLILEKNKGGYFDYRFGTNINKLDSLLKISTSNGNKHHIQYLIAKVYTEKAIHKNKAFELIFNALKEYENRKDTLGLGYCYGVLIALNLSNFGIQEDLTFISKKLINEYIGELENLAKYQPPNSFVHIILSSIKARYAYLVDNNAALSKTISLKAIDDIKTKGSAEINQFTFLTLVGNFYLQNAQFDSAIYYFTKLFKIDGAKRNKISIVANCNLGLVYYYKEQFDISIAYSKKAIEEITKNNIDMAGELQSAYFSLYIAQHDNKQLSEAWEARNTFDSLVSLKLQNTKAQQFEQLQTQFQTEKKEKENQELKLQRKWGFICIAIALVLLSVIVLLFIKTKRQNGKLNELNVFRDKIHAIISHDFRSPLFALQGLYEQINYLIKNKKTGEIEKLSNSIDELSNRMGSLLKNLLTWTQNNSSTSNENQKNVSIFNEVNETILLYQQIIKNKNIVAENNVNKNITASINTNVLDLIIRNWIDNVLKYANPTTINITATKTSSYLQIVIADNGTIQPNILAQIEQQLMSNKSIVNTKNNTGLGLLLIEHFSKQLGWNLQLETCNNENLFLIKIPN
jgi:signal transduction histidine kinase